MVKKIFSPATIAPFEMDGFIGLPEMRHFQSVFDEIAADAEMPGYLN